jgi:imidazolonepropionase-like amidohydrolase
MPHDVEELADEIRRSGAAVIVGPVKPQDADTVVRGLVALGKARVPLAFGGDPTEMRTSAAWLVNAGLPRPDARRALIGQPARAFGLPEDAGQTGSADFVIWTSDPLDSASRPTAVVMKGQRVAIATTEDESTKTDRRPGAATTQPRGRGR